MQKKLDYDMLTDSARLRGQNSNQRERANFAAFREAL